MTERDFFERVRAALRPGAWADDALDELEAHLEDHAAGLEEAGMAPGQARRAALEALGDPAAIGRGLARAQRPRPPWGLLGALLGLTAIGALSVAAFGGRVGMHATWLGLGLLLGLAGWLSAGKRWPRWLAPTWAAGVLLAVAAVELLGPRGAGHAYLPLGPLNIDLASASPIALLVAWPGVLRAFGPALGALLVLLGVAALCALGLIGAAGGLLLGCGALAIHAGAVPTHDRRVLGLAYVLLGAGVLGAAALWPADPVSAPLWEAQLVGASAAGATPAFADAHHVFRQTVLSLGWLPALALVAVGLSVAAILARVGRGRQTWWASLAVGAGIALGGQILWHTLAAVGALPLPADLIRFPLVTYGGTATLLWLFALGRIAGGAARAHLEAGPQQLSAA